MRFTVMPTKASAPDGADVAFLERNSWDDFGFHTLFDLYYRDADGTIHYLGAVKVGSFDLGRSGQPNVPDAFDRLDDQFFSLGQDDSYYAQLNALGDHVRDVVLAALNDVAISREIRKRYATHPPGVTSGRRDGQLPAGPGGHLYTTGGATFAAKRTGLWSPTVQSRWPWSSAT